MSEAFIRFFEELNDFLPEDRKKIRFSVRFFDGETVKSVIENLGIPHTEIDLITVNYESVSFEHRVSNGDLINVYPVFESFDIGPVSKVRQVPLRNTAFILDLHLGKLARMLRMLGFDAVYEPPFDDSVLADRSAGEHRILLTRDRGLLKRKIVRHGYLIRSDDPEKQAAEVLIRFDLVHGIKTFSRCMACNALLDRREKAEVIERLPRKVRVFDEFSECRICGRLYWKGTHWERMRERIGRLMRNAENRSVS